MENIYSEEELVRDSELAWGQWKFSLSDEEISNKLASLPTKTHDNVNGEHWPKLFSTLFEKSIQPESNTEKMDVSVYNVEETSEIENISSGSFQDNLKEPKEPIESDKNISVEVLTECLLDMCNQLAPNLRNGLASVKADMLAVTKDLELLPAEELESVLENVWNHLSTDLNKLCFCIPFCSNQFMTEKLCKIVLFPWLSRSVPSKLEQLSAILSVSPETVCCHLVAPLLRKEDSPLVEEPVNLEELMASFHKKHWASLLQQLLKDLTELQEWQIPVIVNIVEHAQLGSEELHQLVQLMSSAGTTFAQDRDFGALLVAVCCVSSDSSEVIPQLTLLANSYKGPLKFKALKILSEIKD